ncbi:MAG TPA: MarR family winged helix-turn-helix transcriptional regulator [Xanthobacteraceae bacterium]|nr:MarR family winged helix-turn-helix transcriptional regulator [Xanthobacteraceae bacterium]
MLRHARLKAVPGRPDPAKSPPYILDEQVGFLMRVAMQRHTAIFMSRIVEGLTQTQFAALAKLLEVGPCSQNHLGRLIYLDGATIKGVVDRLRARRFVTSQNDPQDKRRRAIGLTESGRRVAEAAVVVAAQITAETLAPLTQEEQRTVQRLLKKLG